MEYTTNYHLPQWVESDRIMMGDFNEAMSNLEGGITTAQEAADAAQSAADNAQSSADKAQDTADAAQAAAEELPYVTGTYTGTGAAKTITLGFRPSFLIISGTTTQSSSSMASLGSRIFFSAGNVLTECVTFTDTGFTINRTSNTVFPQFFTNEVVYDYIAFK